MSQSDNKLLSHQRVFRLNMLIGVIVAAIAIFMIITGQYENIQSRQTTEALLGWTAIVGLLYSVGFWFACMFRQQLFLKKTKQA